MPQGKGNATPALPNRPSWDADDLSLMLRSYDRSPFFTVLSAWLQCGPEPEDIFAFAQKKPDLWAKALGDLARISGYTEKQEVLHTVNVTQMSDSQLEDAAAAMAAKLGISFMPRLLTKPIPYSSDSPLSESMHGKTISLTPSTPRNKGRKRSVTR